MFDADEKIFVYHYTNVFALKSMKTGESYGFGLNYPKRIKEGGLLPTKMHVIDESNLPEYFHRPMIEGLLEENPSSWMYNLKYPALWLHLLNDICLKADSGLVLLNFEVLQTDDAFVLDRSLIEDILYSKKIGESIPGKELDNAYKKFLYSRIPIQDYDKDFSVPQVGIWSRINFDRLNVVWKKDSYNVYYENKDKIISFIQK